MVQRLSVELRDVDGSVVFASYFQFKNLPIAIWLSSFFGSFMTDNELRPRDKVVLFALIVFGILMMSLSSDQNFWLNIFLIPFIAYTMRIIALFDARLIRLVHLQYDFWFMFAIALALAVVRGWFYFVSNHNWYTFQVFGLVANIGYLCLDASSALQHWIIRIVCPVILLANVPQPPPRPLPMTVRCCR